MIKNKVLTIGVAIGLALTLVWIVFAVLEGRYLEAVAASCLGPVLAWFALGVGKSADVDPPDEP